MKLDSLVKKWKKFTGYVEPSIPNPKDTDIYLVSYPKSGNTWMRYLLAHAIWPDIREPDLVDMAKLIPSFGLDIDNEAMLDPGSPCNKLEHRIIKEHFPYNKVAKKYVKNVIYLCRDGRDALISYWHFWNQVHGANLTLDEFIIESANHSYGPWHDHVEHWINAPVNKLIIKYEDLLSNTEICLKKALDFVGLEREDSIINEAVNRSSFGSMKKIEMSKGFNLNMLKNVDFVREGKAGSWKELMDNGYLQIFKNYHGDGIASQGYIW